MTYSDEALTTFIAALGWALEANDRFQGNVPQASWILNCVREGIDAQLATGALP